MTILIFAVITIVVLLVLYLGMKDRALSKTARLSLNKQVFQHRLSELQDELDRQQITQQEYADLELELQKSLLDDAEHVVETNSEKGFHHKVYTASLAIIPLLALAGYFFIADWQEVADWQTLQEKNYQVFSEQLTSHPEIAKLTNRDLVLLMRTELYNNPDNIDGWLQLGQTYAQLGAPNVANQSIDKAVQLAPGDINVKLTAAQLYLLVKDNNATGRAMRQLQDIIAVTPNHEAALTMRGFLYQRMSQPLKAVADWKTVIGIREARGETDGRGITMLKTRVAEVEAQLAQRANPAINQPAQSQLSLRVDLADELRNQLKPKLTVFVIVRGDDGMPAPVAVRRLMVADLPADLTLSDADAMMPGRTLSKMKQLTVTARVSFSGSPAAQPGDWQAAPVTVSKADIGQPVNLIINSKI
ncbi:MAG: c-type cytochrome biogenesis protein CcmI [Kangiellaceae bacterium]|jgi:cytochrome c-type biogenesis protein CcmH|nr:c-type cytochrome biogenesis protein CcmI [Kangiellaceae bacterium]